MTGRRIISGVVSLLFCLALAICCAPPRDAAAEKADVRVGFFAFDGYHMTDADGDRSGYGYDIVQYMSGYTDLQFEFVGYDRSWAEAQELLAAGEIDLLTSAQKTNERLERFDFSEHSIGTSAAILTVKAGNTAYILDDYDNWSGMRVGMIEGNSRNDHFASFAAVHGFTYEPVYYADTEEMLSALQSGGNVDAVVTSNLRRTEGEWILAQFNPSPFYVMVKKGNTALIDEIDRALAKLYAAMPELNELLMEKYYLTASGDNVAFTVDERTVIEASQMRPVTVGIISGSAPVCFYDQKTGRYAGISVEILQAVAGKTGLNLALVPIDLTANTPVSALKERKVDAVAGILKTQVFIDDPELALSDELLADSLVVVGRTGDDFTKNPEKRTIAVPAGFQMGMAFAAAQFPAHRIATYDTLDACMRALVRSEADAAIYMRTSVSYSLQDPHYEALEIVPAFGDEVSTCMAGLAEDKARLFGILNKGLRMITDNERNAVMLNYTILNPYEMTLSDTLYKFRAPILFIAALLLTVIGCLIFIITMRRRNGRKLQLAYEQAQDALAIAEKANASKSVFLSRVSHEMRTPLNAIIGFLELTKDAGPKEAKTYLENSNVAAKQLLAVINDVLDMSAIEAGKVSIARAPFDFKQLVHSVTNVYMQQCAAKGLQYETILKTPVDEWLVGDQLRVNQILFNLLNNAVKFTESGGVTLSIGETGVKEDTVVVRMQVTDTGCGMREEMRARLFTPFEQESSATAAKYGGSGLGLSIVKSLVGLMGGAIRAESKPGAGSAFTVDLPFTKYDMRSNFDLSADGTDLRLLSVDDEESERAYLSTILTRMGVRFTCVSGGGEAISALHEGMREGDPYRICLVDWKMPSMDGTETTRRIRAEFGEDVLVIVVSAYAHNEADAAARAAGANLFIPKPLFQSALYDLFATLTGGRFGKKEQAAPPEKRDFSGRRILLAEDNAMNRMVAEAILSKFGITCECAVDGEIAAGMFAAAPKGYYDAILMDIQMPNMDGFAATRRIRESGRPGAKEIYIIALTANAFNEDIAKSLSCGMNAHVSKPIDTAELAEALDRAFSAAEKEA